MYIRTSEGLGQVPTSSIYDPLLRFGPYPSVPSPCIRDKLPKEIDKWLEAKITDSAFGVFKVLDEFKFRESGLRTRHKTWIKRRLVPAIVASWRTTKPIRTIVLVGHTDAIGDPADNYKLGLARAKAVREEIESQSPGLTSKITIQTYSSGECAPLFTRKKRERRNRRVDVYAMDIVLPPKAAP